MKPNGRVTFSVPTDYNFRMFGRTGCNNQTGNFGCDTADCGPNIECNGAGGKPFGFPSLEIRNILL